jgi:hypothetical protein
METQQCFDNIIHNYAIKPGDPNSPIITTSPLYPQYGFIVDGFSPMAKKSKQYNMQANPLPHLHHISGDESIFTGPSYYRNFVPYGNPPWTQPFYPGMVYRSSAHMMVPVAPTENKSHHGLVLLLLIVVLILLIYKLR